MFKKNKPHLLVVGGTGFIGYHLILAAKKKGWKVTSISLNKPKKYRYIVGVCYLRINIKNFKQLKQKLNGSFTYVVNLGGYVDHSRLKNRRNKIINTHFFGLVNLVKVFLQKKIKRFVQIGSSAEYGNIKAPQNEKQNCKPNSPYAYAKLISTEFILNLSNLHNFPVIILRPFQVYGPKQDQNRILPQVIKACLEDEKFPSTKGEQIREFCYIDDFISAIFLSLKSENNQGEIFNIGSGRPIKIKKVINQIRKIIGKGRPQFGKIKYKEDENMKVYANIKKAKIKLNWRPKVKLNDGLKTVINSF